MLKKNKKFYIIYIEKEKRRKVDMVWHKSEDMKNIKDTFARVVFWIEEYPGLYCLKKGWPEKNVEIETDDGDKIMYDIVFENEGFCEDYYTPDSVLYWAYENELWNEVNGG